MEAAGAAAAADADAAGHTNYTTNGSTFVAVPQPSSSLSMPGSSSGAQQSTHGYNNNNGGTGNAALDRASYSHFQPAGAVDVSASSNPAPVAHVNASAAAQGGDLGPPLAHLMTPRGRSPNPHHYHLAPPPNLPRLPHPMHPAAAGPRGAAPNHSHYSADYPVGVLHQGPSATHPQSFTSPSMLNPYNQDPSSRPAMNVSPSPRYHPQQVAPHIDHGHAHSGRLYSSDPSSPEYSNPSVSPSVQQQPQPFIGQASHPTQIGVARYHPAAAAETHGQQHPSPDQNVPQHHPSHLVSNLTAAGGGGAGRDEVMYFRGTTMPPAVSQPSGADTQEQTQKSLLEAGRRRLTQANAGATDGGHFAETVLRTERRLAACTFITPAKKRGPKKGHRDQLLERMAVIESMMRSGAISGAAVQEAMNAHRSATESSSSPPETLDHGDRARRRSGLDESTLARMEALIGRSLLSFQSTLDTTFYSILNPEASSQNPIPAYDFVPFLEGDDPPLPPAPPNSHPHYSKNPPTLDWMTKAAEAASTPSATLSPLCLQLIYVYFAHVHTRWHPMFHEPLFFGDLQPVNKHPPFLIDAICGAGAMFSTHADLQQLQADHDISFAEAETLAQRLGLPSSYRFPKHTVVARYFIEEANRKLVAFAAPRVDVDSLAVVQALLLIAKVQFGLGDGADSHRNITNAVRMAVRLKIDREYPNVALNPLSIWQSRKHEYTAGQLEARRRTWRFCIMMDTYAGTVSGLPLTIDELAYPYLLLETSPYTQENNKAAAAAAAAATAASATQGSSSAIFGSKPDTEEEGINPRIAREIVGDRLWRSCVENPPPDSMFLASPPHRRERLPPSAIIESSYSCRLDAR
ncbi:fungal-specific transcription factor domain-containing protein, partial [Zopfochytrium polystomum]